VGDSVGKCDGFSMSTGGVFADSVDCVVDVAVGGTSTLASRKSIL